MISGLCFRQSHPSRKSRSFRARTECWLASLPHSHLTRSCQLAYGQHKDHGAISYLSLRNTARSTKHLNLNITWETVVTGRWCCLSTNSFSRVPILQGSLPPGHSRDTNGHLPPSCTPPAQAINQSRQKMTSHKVEASSPSFRLLPNMALTQHPAPPCPILLPAY